MESQRKSSLPHDLSDASFQPKRELSDASESESETASDAESTFPSPCSSIISYDYNPDDFPKACEIEEFQSPSFQWPLSRIVSRNQSAARPASIQYSNIPSKLAAKLMTRMDQLNILLSLSESVLFHNSASSDVVPQVQQTADRAFGLITENWEGRNALADLLQMVGELETAIANMCDLLNVNGMLARPIQLAEYVAKTAGEVQAHQTSYTHCQELKIKAERLTELLWKAGRTDLYERPALRIVPDVDGALHRASALVTKCRAQGNIVRRVFTIIPANSFKNILLEIEDAIGNISWLLRVSKSSSATADDDGYLGLPPIGTEVPILCLIWEQVAKLLKGSPEEKADAAASLVSLARDNDRYGQLIIEEGGVGPLLKLVKEGKVDGQESAANALGLLSRDPESVEVMVQAGACSVFAKVLKEGPMKVQAMVAWAVSELAMHYPQCQDSFAQNDAVRLLVGLLASETMAMAAKALGALARGNCTICRNITDTRIMPLFPDLLEKSPQDVQLYSAILLMEIARMAEAGDADIRCYFFNPTSHDATAIVDQLLRVVRNGEDKKLLVPCVVALGCLSRTFWTSEVTGPLVQLLDEQDTDVVLEATVALTKLAETDNYLHKSHCKAIIDQGGLTHLVQLVYFGEDVQIPAFFLLCYVAKHVPDSEELAHTDAITVLEWASKQSALVQNAIIDRLLPEVKSKLQLYQPEGDRSFH